MTARKKRTARKQQRVGPDAIRCSVHVQRGGVGVQVDHIMLSEAVDLARYVLSRFDAHKDGTPEFSPPQEFISIGGYSPLPVTDDDTLAKRKKRVGF